MFDKCPLTCMSWAVAVAQLAERSLLISQIRNSNPDNGKIYRTIIIHCQLYCIEKTKIKEKEAGNGPFFKNKKTCKSFCGFLKQYH